MPGKSTLKENINLYLSIRDGKANIVEEVLQRTKVDINKSFYDLLFLSDEKISAIDFSKVIGKKEIISFLEEFANTLKAKKLEQRDQSNILKPKQLTDLDSMLFESIEKGDLEEVKFFVERKGVDVNTFMPDDYYPEATMNISYSPIELAVEKGHYKIAEYLLEKGASIEMYPIGNERIGLIRANDPIDIALKNKNTKMLKLLLTNNPNVLNDKHIIKTKGYIEKGIYTKKDIKNVMEVLAPYYKQLKDKSKGMNISF